MLQGSSRLSFTLPPPRGTYAAPIPDSIPFQHFLSSFSNSPFDSTRGVVTGNTCYSPIRTVASAAPTLSVSPSARSPQYLSTDAAVCHQAALARCVAERALKQPNSVGTMFMTITVYLFIISFHVRERVANE